MSAHAASMPVLDPAQQRTVVEYQGLVRKVLKAFRGRGMDEADLYQEGLVGLAIAVGRFDPARGVQLSTYATYWIRAYMMEHVIRSHGPVRIGTTRAQRKIFYGLGRVRWRLERDGRRAEPDELADALGVDVAEVEAMASRLRRIDVSLDEPGRQDDDDRPRGVQVAADGPSPEDMYLARDEEQRQRARLAQVLTRLGLRPREHDILTARHLREHPETLKQLGERFGICRERVRQLERRALTRLRRLAAPFCSERNTMTAPAKNLQLSPPELAVELRRQADAIKGSDHFSMKQRALLIARAEKLEAAGARRPAESPAPAALPADPAAKDEAEGQDRGGGGAAPGGEPGAGGPPRGPRCSKCGEPGHNARTCKRRRAVAKKKTARPAAPPPPAADNEALPEPPRPPGGWFKGQAPAPPRPPSSTETLRGLGPAAPPAAAVEVPGDSAQALVDKVCADLGVPPEHAPRVLRAGPASITIAQDGPADDVDAALTLLITGEPPPSPLERLLTPRANPKPLTADEKALALREIDSAAAAAAAAVDEFLDTIPEASAEDGAGGAAVQDVPVSERSLDALDRGRETRSERCSAFREKVLEDVRAGMDLGDAARKHGANRGTINRWCKEAGIYVMPGRPGQRPGTQKATDGPLVSPAGAVEVRTLDEAVLLSRLLSGAASPQHIEVYVGPPREAQAAARVHDLERLLEWVHGRLVDLPAHLPSITDKADRAALYEILARITTALTDTDRSTSP